MAITPMIHGKIAIKSASAGGGKRSLVSTETQMIVSFVENGNPASPPDKVGIDFGCWSNSNNINGNPRSSASGATTFFDKKHSISVGNETAYVYAGTIQVDSTTGFSPADNDNIIITVELFPENSGDFETSYFGKCHQTDPPRLPTEFVNNFDNLDTSGTYAPNS